MRVGKDYIVVIETYKIEQKICNYAVLCIFAISSYSINQQTPKMKTLTTTLFIVLFTCFSFYANGQDGLVFKRSFLLEISEEGTPLNIPAGSVWKIETAGGQNISSIWLVKDGQEKGEGLFALYVSSTTTHNSIALPITLSEDFKGQVTFVRIARNSWAYLNIVEYTISK